MWPSPTDPEIPLLNPSRKYWATYRGKLDDLTTENRIPDIYVKGDLNLPEIDWEFLDNPLCKSQSDQQAAKELLDFAEINLIK